MKHSTTAPDPLIVDLWPGTAPGDVGITIPESTRYYEGPLTGRTLLFTGVTRPSIHVYRPEKQSNTGTALITCPGGGYHDLFWELEGEEVAAWCTSVGITGIILKYRCPRRPGDQAGVPPRGPQIDAQRALSIVRSRAAEWGIHPGRIGIVGFSAGGHLSIATATEYVTRLYAPIDGMDTASCRPDFAIGCYSGYFKEEERDALGTGLRIPPDAPPVLFVHSSDDTISSAENSVIPYLAFRRAGISAELHIYATGEHDFGVRQTDKLPSSWTGLCLRWLRSLGLYTEVHP
jgi:acetyl esterase/lipase